MFFRAPQRKIAIYVEVQQIRSRALPRQRPQTFNLNYTEPARAFLITAPSSLSTKHQSSDPTLSPTTTSRLARGHIEGNCVARACYSRVGNAAPEHDACTAVGQQRLTYVSMIHNAVARVRSGKTLSFSRTFRFGQPCFTFTMPRHSREACSRKNTAATQKPTLTPRNRLRTTGKLPPQEKTKTNSTAVLPTLSIESLPRIDRPTSIRHTQGTRPRHEARMMNHDKYCPLCRKEFMYHLVSSMPSSEEQ